MIPLCKRSSYLALIRLDKIKVTDTPFLPFKKCVPFDTLSMIMSSNFDNSVIAFQIEGF